MQAVLADHLTAPVSEKLRALLVFIEKVNRASNEIGPPDVERAKAAGWTDEALYDAITVCALFNFYNVWVDATGVQDMPEPMYEQSGKRLAQNGYVFVAGATGATAAEKAGAAATEKATAEKAKKPEGGEEPR